MQRPITSSELEAYLDEGLPAEEMARIERALRDNARLLGELAAVRARRDTGVHSLGEVWRRRRLTCPSRDELGTYLLGVESPVAKYVAFHLQSVGCRLCLANADDLRRQQAEAPELATHRRRRFFQSSAGYLRRE